MPELIFVIDPMCSWSWGFHPVIEELRHRHGAKYTYALVVGGLRTTGDMAWNPRSKAYLRQNWDAVSQRTGQVFSPSLLERDSFDYDTYPACKALVTVRALWGDVASFEYLTRIQEAFYTGGIDITSAEVLTRYVTQDRSAFQIFFASEKAETLMHHDFSKARAMGANAFPSIVKIDKEGHMVCMKGYRRLEEILDLS